MINKSNKKIKEQTLEDIFIRVLQKADLDDLIKTFCFPWSSVQALSEKWTRYYDEHQEQIRTVYLLEKHGKIMGYASLLYLSKYPHFRNEGIPEINDLWISENWRNKGFGKMMIHHLEDIARAKGYKQIGLGVGLYKDYGPAQKLYFRLGYTPDGYGITYNYQPTITGESYPLDDDLILWLKKSLEKEEASL